MNEQMIHTTMNDNLSNDTSTSCKVTGRFYYRDFGFESIEFENTEDGTVKISCNSPEDLVTSFLLIVNVPRWSPCLTVEPFRVNVSMYGR